MPILLLVANRCPDREADRISGSVEVKNYTKLRYQGKSMGLSTPLGLSPLVLAGVGTEGAEKFLGIWGRFSLIFFIKSMNLTLNPQKISRLRRAFPETSIFEL